LTLQIWKQVFRGFTQSSSECWDGSQVPSRSCALLMQALPGLIFIKIKFPCCQTHRVTFPNYTVGHLSQKIKIPRPCLRLLLPAAREINEPSRSQIESSSPLHWTSFFIVSRNIQSNMISFRTPRLDSSNSYLYNDKVCAEWSRNRGSILGTQKYFSPFHNIQTGSVATEPTIQWVSETSSPGEKRPGREASHWPPSNGPVNNKWSYTSTPSNVFIALFSTNHRDVVNIVTGRCHSTDADLVSAVTNADIVTATTDMHCEWVEAFQR
jgi:hypothetical protein